MVSGDAAACGDVDLIEKRDDGFFRLMYAAGHCHAPACMSIELWNADTGELICRNVPIYGNRCGRLAGIPARTRSPGRCRSLCSPSAPGRPVPFNNSVLTPTLRALPPPIVLCSSPLFVVSHIVNGASTEAHNEESYLVGIPPCLWGSNTEGLLPPPRLHLDANLTSIKRANSTNGHWGVMALWQMRAAYDDVRSSLPRVPQP